MQLAVSILIQMNRYNYNVHWKISLNIISELLNRVYVIRTAATN